MTRSGRDDSCAMLFPMFTGIVTDIGELVDRREGRFAIRCGYQAEGIAIGASIACDGTCLTATDIRSADNGCVFTVDVSNETLSRTTLGDWRPGARINLERALKAGDELRADGSSRRFIVEVPAEFAVYLAPKGSVALDGISLTVNEVTQSRFGINIVPHTLTHTTLGAKKPGDRVNLEADVFARYVARAMELRT